MIYANQLTMDLHTCLDKIFIPLIGELKNTPCFVSSSLNHFLNYFMDKKPIKRNENIVKLSREHHTTLLFCWKIRNGLKNGAEPGRILKYVQYFRDVHMMPHFKLEEDILFAPVKDSMVQKALEDHKNILHQVELLETGGTDIETSLTNLADTVDNHVRYEERELFPHLERVLNIDQLSAIGQQMKGDEDHPDDFADEFWVKK